MEEVDQLTITDLLEEGSYLIPLYQRNYAWTRDEIHQLLKDIKESDGYYYLGTLVVSISSGKYVVIDGQQRHTTLSLINAVLKNRNLSEINTRNLYFEARDTSEAVLDTLLHSGESYEMVSSGQKIFTETQNFVRAIHDIESYFNEEFKENDEEVKKFADRFYNRIILFRAALPKKTDLNHYFEIMNNRGEQLEEHEILKAAFMNYGELAQNPLKQKLFATIWEACSQMDCHVQTCFEQADRIKLFGESLIGIPNVETLNNFVVEELPINNTSQSGIEGKNDNSLLSIIHYHTPPEKFTQDSKKDTNTSEKFNSIIDFSNFLLIVLKLSDKKMSPNEIRLDDKFLLKDFGYPNNLPNSWDFIALLLKCRILFDRYIIKREGGDNDWNWTIRTLLKNLEYQSTFSSTEDDGYRRKLRMIQSMYQVSMPSNTYKTWLFDIIHYLESYYQNSLSASTYLHFIEKRAFNYYNNRKLDRFYNSGLQIPRFLFNYIDYILWKEYYDRVRNQDNIYLDSEKHLKLISQKKEKFNSFKFVQRSSIEHLFPRSRYMEIEAETEGEKLLILNSIGNLCLINNSSNSAYSNDLPYQKKHDSKSKNESLKQVLMLESFNGDKWNTVEIKEHKKVIIQLLEKNTMIL
ncbi:MAG: DUF262 domain-containing protein [Paludibacter sp.]